MSYYTSAGGSSRTAGRRTGGAGSAAAIRQLEAAQRASAKANEAEALREALLAIFDLHRIDFAPARRPVAPPAAPVDESSILAKHVAAAKSDTSVFARTKRKEALAQAAESADAEVSELRERNERESRALQAELDAYWAALCNNEPDTVLLSLMEAFEDNEAAAAAIGVDGNEVTLIVLAPPASSIPERKPTTTNAGNLSLKKLTKREASDMYKQLLCGHVLVTLKEAFAVAPSIAAARVVALRQTPPDAYGKVRPEVMLAARFERAALDGIQWATADAVQVVNDASSEIMFTQKGATQEIVPLDLAAEPELAAVMSAVDFDELL